MPHILLRFPFTSAAIVLTLIVISAEFLGDDIKVIEVPVWIVNRMAQHEILIAALLLVIVAIFVDNIRAARRGKREAKREAERVGRRWSVSFREKTGGKIHLATSHERNSGADSRTVVHVAGRDRLAASGAQLPSADGGVKLIYRELICHGICSWHTARMVASRATLPYLDVLNPNELKALIVSQHELIGKYRTGLCRIQKGCV